MHVSSCWIWRKVVYMCLTFLPIRTALLVRKLPCGFGKTGTPDSSHPTHSTTSTTMLPITSISDEAFTEKARTWTAHLTVQTITPRTTSQLTVEMAFPFDQPPNCPSPLWDRMWIRTQGRRHTFPSMFCWSTVERRTSLGRYVYPIRHWPCPFVSCHPIPCTAR